MNCANHPQNSVAAYCRTCGKPLCSDCSRSVAGVVYCENCLTERVAGTAPPASGFQPGPGYAAQVQPGSGPNPALAGILGAIPFGVGAIYCGQYVKGLVYLGIFIFLVVAQSSNIPDYLHVILGLTTAFFVIYQIVDAVRTAKAIQAGQPVPDPFGLVAAFGPVEKVGARREINKGIPTGAVVLIGLGVLFLLHNLGIWFLEVDRIWPVFLIAIGVWLFAKRRMCSQSPPRSIIGPAILVTIGVLSLLENLHGPGWDRTWPVILLVIGVIKLMERGYFGGPPTAPPPATPGETYSTGQPPAPVNSE